jgi:hypothetical protein
MMLLMLRWALTLNGLMMHGDTHVSLVLRGVRRRMRSGRAVS